MLSPLMNGVLNETTDTVHKYETGESDLQAECGATSHVPHDNLRVITAVESAIDARNASKCGRCFEEGGGY